MKSTLSIIAVLAITLTGLTACSSTPPKLPNVNSSSKEKPINNQEWVDYAKKKASN